MEYFKPTAEIKSARNINRVLMVVSYLAGIGLWIFFLNQRFGYDPGEPSANVDGLVYLPALFATPIVALFFIPPAVWLGGIWRSRNTRESSNEPSFRIWLHTQPPFSLFLSALSLLAYPAVCFITLFWQWSLFNAR